MPIIRYFVFTCSLLLALLFAADRYLPPPPDRAGERDIDKTIIRIRSARRLPERIVFDTASRAIAPASTGISLGEPGNWPEKALAMN